MTSLTPLQVDDAVSYLQSTPAVPRTAHVVDTEHVVDTDGVMLKLMKLHILITRDIR